MARFSAGAAAVADRLRDRAAHATGSASEVLAATAQLAQDRAWLGEAQKRIKTGTPAVRATAEAVEKFADLFTKMGGLMAERVTDLKDIRDRVIAQLSGLPEPGVPLPDVPSILCAEDLAPADTAGLDPALIVGLATSLGGPTSHTAIIARQLAIPCVVATRGLDTVAAGTMVIIDGERGTLGCPRMPPRPRPRWRPERRPPRRPRIGRSRRHVGWPADLDPGERAGRCRCPVGRADTRRGHRPVPHRAVLPEP